MWSASRGLQIAVERLQTSVQNLFDGFQQRIVSDVQTFIQRMTGELLQASQTMHLHRYVLDVVEIHVEELQLGQTAKHLGKRVDAVSLNDEDLQVGQRLDLIGDVFQSITGQLQEHQALHGVNAAGDVCDLIVAQVELL